MVGDGTSSIFCRAVTSSARARSIRPVCNWKRAACALGRVVQRAGSGGEAGHGSYQRRPADLPLLGRSVQSVLRGRRFRCRNAACGRRTFAERLSGLVAAHARRTRRLAAAQSAVAVALGGEAGARLLPRLSRRPECLA